MSLTPSLTPFQRRSLATFAITASLFTSAIAPSYADPVNFLYDACPSCAPKDLAY
ncbi:MAG: hypothetical protein HYZ45_07230, partial [Burkholderiales bacterium]|nr:hypothetical protein [Burkholderiales bacterium]